MLFFGQNGTPSFVMSRGYPPPDILPGVTADSKFMKDLSTFSSVNLLMNLLIHQL